MNFTLNLKGCKEYLLQLFKEKLMNKDTKLSLILPEQSTKDQVKNTLGGVLIVKKILKVRNSCVCGKNVKPLISL